MPTFPSPYIAPYPLDIDNTISCIFSDTYGIAEIINNSHPICFRLYLLSTEIILSIPTFMLVLFEQYDAPI